ncbi:hypothetical protein [Streptosporangium amethystogenes]|uniref:hypothetical protein n=1 Tax=Streptosporangium amethystogenes TaxID=2002 RepID=UPI0004CA4114|nr:hypothetical protein [Streptosporangium amethystogenes]
MSGEVLTWPTLNRKHFGAQRSVPAPDEAALYLPAEWPGIETTFDFGLDTIPHVPQCAVFRLMAVYAPSVNIDVFLTPGHESMGSDVSNVHCGFTDD